MQLRSLVACLSVTAAAVAFDATSAACTPLPPIFPVPTNFGLDRCLGNNLNDVLGALGGASKCQLSQVMALAQSPSVKALAGLASKAMADPGRISAVLYEHMAATNGSQMDAFCADWSQLISPCAEVLAPLFLQKAASDLECCGGISDLFDQLSMIVPPNIDKASFLLTDVVDGVNQLLCAKREDTKQTCGASIFQQLTTKYSATEFRLLESFLMPFITAAPGHECNALQGLDFLSSATLRPAPKAIDYSCCASHARPLLESLQAAFTFLTGTTPFEFLNGIVEFADPSTMKFVDALQAAKSCAFKATCSAPAGLINYKTRVVAPGTNRPPTNDLGTTQCKRVQRCDAAGQLCSEVCERGSVEVPAWVQQSLAYQRRLAYGGPLCRAQLPATHNSAITLADGFGNRDQLMNANLSPKKPYSYMKTNNHVLSLRDQLDMGVRWLEIDTHFFLGDFRTAHCGALGSNSIQVLASVFKEQLAKFGRVSWIPELLGCFPSLSGIKATEQRTSRETMREIRAWLDRPENKREIVFVYMDQGVELRALGKFGELNAMLQDVFGELLVPIAQLEALQRTGWHQSNATLQQFIDAGRRVVLLANDNTGLALGISQYCGGHEILKSKFINDLPDAARTIGGKKIYGTDYYLRSYEPVLRYISLSGTGSFSRELPLMLNAGNLYNYVRWNLNLVATDSLESSMLAPQVWSWSENEPAVTAADAAVFMQSSGRWVSSTTLPKTRKACWNAGSLEWSVVAFSDACPSGSAFVGPQDPYQNYLLHQRLLAQENAAPVVINVTLDGTVTPTVVPTTPPTTTAPPSTTAPPATPTPRPSQLCPDE